MVLLRKKLSASALKSRSSRLISVAFAFPLSKPSPLEVIKAALVGEVVLVGEIVPLSGGPDKGLGAGSCRDGVGLSLGAWVKDT